MKGFAEQKQNNGSANAWKFCGSAEKGVLCITVSAVVDVEDFDSCGYLNVHAL